MRVERVGAIAVVRMEAPKGNAMDRAFLGDFKKLFDEVENSDARGVVLTGKGPFFSVGMALPELLPLSRDDMRTFLGDVSCTLARLMSLPIPIVAAVNGHAVAGGCVLGLYCDYRVAGGGPWRLGFSEVQIGIGLPPFITEALRQAVHKPADWVAVAHRGRMMSPKEAQSVGLVDEVVLGEQVEAMALYKAKLLAERPQVAFAQVKSEYRRPAIAAMKVDADARNEAWLDTWFSSEAQALLKKSVARLSGSRGK